VLGPPHLTFAGAADGVQGPAEILAETLAVHGSKLTCALRIFPRALVPGKAQAQIDIGVSAPALGERRITESFAAWGPTIREGYQGAMARFNRGSLHVLLAALEDERLGEDQVEWEPWGPGFRACLGGLLRQWSPPPPLDFGALLDTIKDRLLAANLSREIHWHRIFVAVGPNGLLVSESLLDNEEWPPGVEVITSWPWPRAAQAYAIREFLILVPAQRDRSEGDAPVALDV
jgi:hypothetical protein